MKKFIQIIVTIVVFLVTQTIAFAQPPTDFGSNSNSTDTNQTDLPIDAYIWVVILVGIAYVFSKFNRSKA